MTRDLLHKIMFGVFVALVVMLSQPFAGTVMGQTFSDFPDQQIRFTPTAESQQILDDLKNNFDPETRGGENYPPIWNYRIATENMHGIYIPLAAIPHINDIPISVNDYIGGFFQDENGDLKCAGATHWTDTAGIVFPLFGDDPKTPVKDGFAWNEVLKFKLFSFENMKEYLVDVVAYEVSINFPAKDKWQPSGLSKVVNMKAIENLDFYISSSANPVCEGNQIVLQGNEFIGTGGPYVFNWSSDPPGFNYNTQFPPATTPLQTTTYHLTVNDGALQSEHELTVLVNAEPAVDAGSNAAVCANSVLQLNGTSENTIATLWTTSGDGTFGQASELGTTYTPGTLDNTNGQAVLTLTGLPLNPCDEVAVDNLTATILRLPIVNAGADKTVCTNEDVILHATAQHNGAIEWTTSGDGTFSSPTSLTTQYFGAGNDFTYGVTLTFCSQAVDPCVANVCDAMHVTYVPGPTANGPSYKTYCENQSVPLNGSATNYSSTLWTTQGDGTFSSPTTFVTSYFPGTQDRNNAGVIVTLTAFAQGNCAPATKDVNITLVQLPEIISFGNNAGNMCFTDAFKQLNATIQNAGPINWSTNGDGTFNSKIVANPKYYPGVQDRQNKSFTLSLTLSPLPYCATSTTGTLTVTIQDNPMAQAGADVTSCQGQTITLFDASGTSYSGVLWSTSGSGTFSNPATLKPVYTPSTADINSGSVQLTLTTAPISPCAVSASDSRLLTIIKNATANTGADATICETQTHQLTTASASNYTSLLWSSNGDGTFSSTTILKPTYTPGDDDKTAGSVTLTLKAYPNSPCVGVVSDAMQLTIQRNVTANAGNNATICETQTHQLATASASNYGSLLWSTSGDGTFSSTAILKPTYTPGVADKNNGSVVLTLLATAISPCSLPTTSTKTLTIIRNATANAGSDAQICESNTHTLSGTVTHTNSFVWTTSGDGTFNNPSALAPVYTPGNSDKATGLATLTLTAQQNAPCIGTPSDAMQLTIQRNVIANAGSNATICETQTHQLATASASNYTSLLWSTSGDGTFSSTITLKPTYTPGVADKNSGGVVLTLQATAVNPCSLPTTSTKTLTIIRNVTADAGSDAGICETNTYTLSGTVTHTNSFVWTTSGDGTFNNPNALAPVYTPGNSDKATGLVTLTLTAQQNAPCVGTPSDAMQLTIQRNVTANAGNNATICETQTHQLTTASASNYGSLLWSTSGDGTFSNTTTLKPAYTPGVADKNNGSVVLTLQATAISPCSLPKTSTKTLTIIRNATANAGSDAQICETQTHQLSTASASNYASLLWSTSGDGTFSSTTTLKPTYTPGIADKNKGSVVLTLQATAISPCSLPKSDTKTLTIQRNVTANAGTDATICETANHPLSTASASNYTSLLWSTNGDGTFSNTTILKPIYIPGVADKNSGSVVLTLKATAISPCSMPKTDTKTLTITRNVIVSAGNDVTVCSDGGQLNGNAQHYANIQWSTTGDGTFNNASSLSPVYVPGPQDITARQATLTIAAGSISPCTTGASDQVKMIIDVPYVISSSVNNQLLQVGKMLVFTFNVASAQPGEYKWYANGNEIPGQTGSILIIFDVMPANAGEYQAVFTNSCGVVESDIAMVTLLQPYAQQLTIPEGWSGISSFVTPLNPALETVFSPIANDLILMANNSGIYWPGQNLNTLGNLEITEGYKIKMQNSAQVAVSGNVRYPLSALTIPAGWSYLPVNTPCEENVEQFAAYPQITMIKEIAGTGIYWPEMGINTIGNLIPGKAYFILNNSASPLVMKYQGCNGFKTSMVMPVSAVTSPWPMVAATPVTHVFGFTREALAEFTDGDLIGAFDAKGNCVGAMQVDKMQYTNTLIVFGADNTDEFARGIDLGERVRFRSLRQLENAEVEMEVAFASRNASDGYFTENGISVIDRAAACATGIENQTSADAAQIKVYPNPTRGELVISLGNISLRDASVVITNQNGQVMLRQELVESNTQLNLENLPRGIYHLRITTGALVKVERIILN